MSEWKIPLAAVAVGALFVGVNEQVTWILWPLGVTAGVAALAAVCLLRGQTGRGSAYGFHNTTGHSDSHVRRHERGHYNVARRLGARARIELDNPDGPVTRVWDDHLSPVEQAAIAYGGWARAGSSGCEGDNQIIKENLRQLPRSERASADREARRIARRYA